MKQFETKSVRNTRLRGTVFDEPSPVRAVLSLVHGFGEHCGRYADMAKALSDSGIATVALDLRGHGRSDGKRGVVRNYNEYFADLECLLETSRARHPDVPHILYGHSMGGGLVLNYMLRETPRDITAVIASAPLLRLAEPVPGPLKLIMKGLTKLLPDFALSQPIKGEAVSSLPEEQARYVKDPLNHGTLGGRLALGMIARGEESVLRASEFSKPLLILHSKDDALTDFDASEAFARQVPTCQFVAFEGVAHEMHNDTSRPKVYSDMIQFIESHI